MKGLTEKQAKFRLQESGKNKIISTSDKGPFKILLSQFTSPLMLIMIGAAVVAYGVGFLPGQESQLIDVALILIIVLISAIAGFFQEHRAEKAIQALQKMAMPIAKVVRDGKKKELRTDLIVPGDLVLLESGDIIPADARLVKCWDLELNEAPITGESEPARKKEGDDVFMNTFIYNGSAEVEVTTTGMNTTMGAIAKKLESVEKERSPFQMEMADISRKIMYIILGILVVMIVVGFFKYGWVMSVLTALSLAVAAIPQGLPIVVTLTLALGARMLAKRNALVRKLSVTETLGSVNVICTDKTGTLTKNEMEVKQLYYGEEERNVAELNKEDAGKLIKCGVLCNNSTYVETDEGEEKFVGDQTEVALRKIGDDVGFQKEVLEERIPRKQEFSFDSERKMMSVVVVDEGNPFVYAKGAPEVLIDKCQKIRLDGEERELTEKDKQTILDKNKEYASQALRILGFAYKPVDESTLSRDEAESGLVWLGLQAMYDPPREEVKDALDFCRTSGIRVAMVTGDNPVTAKAIAEELGIESERVIEGKALDAMSNDELKTAIDEGVNLFARISPFHKQNILNQFQVDNIVAMTGDGVNDALAIKNADVGIAMGIKGTEVSKGSSDMILLDDNFATIIEAIRFGRGIFENIQKFLNYLFTCNVAEVGVIFISTLLITLNEPVLLPVQILWINVMTDGLPAIALGMDPPRPGIMKDPPRHKGATIFNSDLRWMVLGVGSIMILFLLGLFLFAPADTFIKSRTLLFTGFVIFEFVRIASIRFNEELTFFSNKWLVGSLAISLLIQVLIVHTPVNRFFDIVPLSWMDWGFLVGAALLGFLASIGYSKLMFRSRKPVS